MQNLKLLEFLWLIIKSKEELLFANGGLFEVGIYANVPDEIFNYGGKTESTESYSEWATKMLPTYSNSLNELVNKYLREKQYLSGDDLENMEFYLRKMKAANYQNADKYYIDAVVNILINKGAYKNDTIREQNTRYAVSMIRESAKAEKELQES